MYRPPKGVMTVFENLLSGNGKTSKSITFAGDLNINVLDYESHKKIRHFLTSTLG